MLAYNIDVQNHVYNHFHIILHILIHTFSVRTRVTLLFTSSWILAVFDNVKSISHNHVEGFCGTLPYKYLHLGRHGHRSPHDIHCFTTYLCTLNHQAKMMPTPYHISIHTVITHLPHLSIVWAFFTPAWMRRTFSEVAVPKSENMLIILWIINF